MLRPNSATCDILSHKYSGTGERTGYLPAHGNIHTRRTNPTSTDSFVGHKAPSAVQQNSCSCNKLQDPSLGHNIGSKAVPVLGTARTGPRSNTQGRAHRATLAFDTQRAVRAPTRAASRVLVHAQGRRRHALSFSSHGRGPIVPLPPHPFPYFAPPPLPEAWATHVFAPLSQLKKGGGST